MYRQFSNSVEKIASQWFELVETKDSWAPNGKRHHTESQPFEVQTVDLKGLAKPGRIDPSVRRAAHEKIASDLAYHLRLPVPPVILWDRGASGNEERYVAISLWAFEQIETWDKSFHSFSEEHKKNASLPVTAMHVFENWIGGTDDRKSDHVLVDQDSPVGTLGLAFIDYAFSMSYKWKGSNEAFIRAASYMPVLEDKNSLKKVTNDISGFPDTLITKIVNRIPDAYLPEPEKRNILSNLLIRKGKINTIIV